MGLTQEGLAKRMGFKRGRIAGYFYKTQAKQEFHDCLAEEFDLNVGRFLTVVMTHENYDSFFISTDTSPKAAEEQGYYTIKSDLINLLIQAKSEEEKSKKELLIDRALLLYGKILDENSRLKDINSELKDQLLVLLNENRHN